MLKVELLSRTSQALGVGFVGKQELLLLVGLNKLFLLII